jgi:outer membrane protein OmpA-like peptidoglycan-associated protein/Mg-chelatase subunit ChlD
MAALSVQAQGLHPNHTLHNMTGHSSPDSRLLVTLHFEKSYVQGFLKYIYEVRIYHVRSRSFLARRKFHTFKPVEEVLFASHGRNALVRADQEVFLLDLARGQIQRKFDGVLAINFVEEGRQLFLIQLQGKASLWDVDAAKPLMAYQGLPTKGPQAFNSKTRITQSPCGEFIMAASASGCHVWQKNHPALSWQAHAEGAAFTGQGQLAVLQPDGRQKNFHIYRYNAGYQEWALAHTLSNSSFRDPLEFNCKAGASISPNGKYGIWVSKSRGTFEALGIFDLKSLELVFEIKQADLDHPVVKQDQPYFWLDGDRLTLLISGQRALVYTDTHWPKPDTLSLKRTYRDYQYSPHFNLLASFYTIKKNDDPNLAAGYFFQVNNMRNPKETFQLDGRRFLTYSSDEQFIFMHSRDTSVLFFEPQFQRQRMKYYIFPKEVSPVASESEITQDSPPPPGYSHTYLQQPIPYGESAAKDQATLHFKTLHSREQGADFQFHLLDPQGNYLVGATLEALNKLWCEVNLYKAGEKVPMPPLQLQERHTATAPPLYLGLVLDHSGSMGEERARLLQEAVRGIIDEKRPEDAMLLVKYDGSIALTARVCQSSDSLKALFPVAGLDGFGGATALLDGAYLAVQQLSRLPNNREKQIILFTDGHENSSLVTRPELIRFAREKQVAIHTIGFGDAVDTQYLSYLSRATGGSFYHVYDRHQLQRFYRDVILRLQNHYSLQFEPPGPGSYHLEIKPCGKEKAFHLHFRHRETFEDDPIPEKDPDAFDRPPVIGEVRLLAVHFHFDTIELTEASVPELEKAMAYLQAHPGYVFELRGHTDGKGSESYNQVLSEKRAHIIKKWLVARGIPGHQLRAVGYGEGKPIADNDTEEGRASNRRTEFVAVGRVNVIEE